MAEDETPPQSGGKPSGGKPAQAKSFFISKNSTFDEYLVNKGEKSVTKDFGWNEPTQLTEDEAKDARAMGVTLTEATTT